MAMKEVLNPYNFTLYEAEKITDSILKQRSRRSQFDELMIWLCALAKANQRKCICEHYECDHHSPGGGWAGYGDLCQVKGCGCRSFESSHI